LTGKHFQSNVSPEAIAPILKDAMKIAVLGGGHGAYAAAADLTLSGHEVRLWRRDGAALAPLLAHGGIHKVLKKAAESAE
jgi:opine dehydrogenase